MVDQETLTPGQVQPALVIVNLEVSVSLPAPEGSKLGRPAIGNSEPRPGLQLKIAIPYLAALLISFWLSISYAGENFKVAMAWLIVGVVSSQVVVDLATFSSPKIKANLSATYRIVGVLAVLCIAYLG